MARYEHTGGAAVTTLVAPITDDAMTFTVADATGYPTGVVGPFWVVLGATTANEEKVLCASRAGNVFTVNSGGRGGDGTTAVPHNAAEQVRHIFTATEADDANEHIESAVAHGRSSALVGINDVQTLTGKTISGATNTISGLAQSSTNGLVDRLTVPFWRGYKASPNTINPGIFGSPGTLTTLTSSGITTPSGAHSTAKRVPKDGLYLVEYRLRYGTGSGAVEVGDFRLRLGLNPIGDGVDPLESGTVVAESQNRHAYQPGRRTHVRTSLSITISNGVTSEIYDALNLGATLPQVPYYVGVNLHSGDGVASGWNIRTDEYTTTTFRLILDRHVATVGSLVCPIRIFAIYDDDDNTGHSVELTQVLDLNENDILVFRVWNNGATVPVEIHEGQEYSQASITWIGPSS